MKKVVRINESELKHMIMESVKRVLNESLDVDIEGTSGDVFREKLKSVNINTKGHLTYNDGRIRVIIDDPNDLDINELCYTPGFGAKLKPVSPLLSDPGFELIVLPRGRRMSGAGTLAIFKVSSPFDYRQVGIQLFPHTHEVGIVFSNDDMLGMRYSPSKGWYRPNNTKYPRNPFYTDGDENIEKPSLNW